jgi:hypothetical protein
MSETDDTTVERGGQHTAPGKSNRDPMIPRPAITLIALALTGGMLWNVFRDGAPLQTLILGGVVSSILGVDWIVKWLLR